VRLDGPSLFCSRILGAKVRQAGRRGEQLVPTGLQARGGLGGFNLMLAQPGRVMPLLIKPRDYDKTLKRHREHMEREEERERRRQRGCAFQ